MHSSGHRLQGHLANVLGPKGRPSGADLPESKKAGMILNLWKTQLKYSNARPDTDWSLHFPTLAKNWHQNRF